MLMISNRQHIGTQLSHTSSYLIDRMTIQFNVSSILNLLQKVSFNGSDYSMQFEVFVIGQYANRSLGHYAICSLPNICMGIEVLVLKVCKSTRTLRYNMARLSVTEIFSLS